MLTRNRPGCIDTHMSKWLEIPSSEIDAPNGAGLDLKSATLAPLGRDCQEVVFHKLEDYFCRFFKLARKA